VQVKAREPTNVDAIKEMQRALLTKSQTFLKKKGPLYRALLTTVFVQRH